MDYSINFPHLHIFLEHVGKEIRIGNFPIALYGVVIATGILVGIYLACREAKRTGQKEEDYLDLALYAVLFSVIGARIYYVIFQIEYYIDNPLSIINIREGGLAIYGAIIAAVITVYVFSKVKKIPFGRMIDTACMGLVMGQVIGRWGNFFNREVFGGYTDGLFAMQIPLSAVRDRSDVTQTMLDNLVTVDGVSYIQVHPTFLYEGLWNLALFLLLNLYKNHTKFSGELFLLYIGGYGLGRAWIEGVRTDQLYIWNTHIAVSQVLSIVLVVGSVLIDIIVRKKLKTQKV